MPSAVKLPAAAVVLTLAANAAVLGLLAKALQRPKSAVSIVRGETARVKQVEVDGVEAADLARAFGNPPS